MDKKPESLSLLIPAYNEEELLESSVEYYYSYLAQLMRVGKISDFEIIICVNGSTNNTGYAAESISKKYKNVSFFETKQKGIGIALTLGIMKAKKDNITYMPGDGEYDASFIGYALEEIDEHSFIVGSRKIAGGYAGKNLLRKFLSHGLNFLTTTMFSSKAIESSGVKMFRKDWALRRVHSFRENGFPWQVEIMYYALLDGLKIKHVKSKTLHRRDISKSSVEILDTVYVLFNATLKYGFMLKREQIKRLLRLWSFRPG